MTDNQKTDGAAGSMFDVAKEICDAGEATLSASELETRRKVFMRVNEIVLTRLDRDALKLEQEAIVGNGSIQTRHQLMDLARCLRTTATWLVGPPTDKPSEPQAN